MARETDDTYDNYLVSAAQSDQSYYEHTMHPKAVRGNRGYDTHIAGANKQYEIPFNVRIQRPLPTAPAGRVRPQNVAHLNRNAQRPMATKSERSYDSIIDGVASKKELPFLKIGLIIIAILAASCIILAALFAVSSLKNGEMKMSHDKVLSNLTRENARLIEMLQRTDDRNVELLNRTSGLRPVRCTGFSIYGRCYGVIIIGSGGMDYHDAKRVCAYDGVSNIGNIYTLNHFNKLRDHVIKRKGESRHAFINVWTGMTIDLIRGKILLTTGAVATYQGEGNQRNSKEWRTDEARRTNVYISFWTDSLDHSSNPGGYGNVWPTHIWHAVLCERMITV